MSLLEESGFSHLNRQERVKQEAFRTLEKSTYKQRQVHFLRLSLRQRMATWFVIACFSLVLLLFTFFSQENRRNFFPGDSYKDYSETLVITRIISLIIVGVGVVQGVKLFFLQQDLNRPLEDSKKQYEDLEKEIGQTRRGNINCILEKNERLKESNQELNSYLHGVSKIGTLGKDAKLALAGLGTGMCVISLILESPSDSLTIISGGVGVAGVASYLGQKLDEKRRYQLLYHNDNKRIKMLGQNSTLDPIIVRTLDENFTTESMLLRGDSTASLQLEAGSDGVSSHS